MLNKLAMVNTHNVSYDCILEYKDVWEICTRCYGKTKKGYLALTRGETSRKASLKVEMPKQSTQESTGTTQNNVGKHIPESSM